MEDYIGYDVVIMSEEDDASDDDEDTTYLLSHDNRVSKLKSPPSNLVTIPIGGSTKTRMTNNNNNHKSREKPETNDSVKDPVATPVERTGNNDVTENETRFDDMTESTSSDSTSIHGDPITYRRCGYAFSDKESKEVLRSRKKVIVHQMLLICLIVLLQSIGFVLYVPDVLLVNISDVNTQHVTYVLVLVTCALSATTAQFPINSLGNKWMLFIGCIGSSLFSCARFFGTLPFMIPASIVAGLTQGPFMVAQYSYVTQLARDYASYENGKQEIVAGIFYGFLNSWVFISPALGVLLRYMFLSSETAGSFRDQDTLCGKDFCWDSGLALFESNKTESRDVNANFRIQALLGCYLVCSLGGAMLACLNTGSTDVGRSVPMLSVSDYAMEEDEEPCCSRGPAVEVQWSWMWDGVGSLCDGHVWLMFLLLVYVGGQQLVAYSIFVQTFSQCQADLAVSLLVVVTLSVGGLLGSIPSGYISAVFGKVKVTSLAYVIQVIFLIVMVTATHLPQWTHFIIGLFWGISDAMLQSVVISIDSWTTSADSGAALCCLRFCQMIGYLFLASFQIGHVCNRAILITTLCVLTLAMMCYIAMEITVRLDLRAAKDIPRSRYVPLSHEPSWLPNVNPVHVRQDRTESLSLRLAGYRAMDAESEQSYLVKAQN